MLRLLPVLLIVGACAGPTPSGTSPASAPEATSSDLISREAIFGNPQRTQGRISPDGQWLSWLAPDAGVMNVWIAPTDDPENAKAVTADRNRGIRVHYWTRDSRFLLYTQDSGGDENTHVYAVSLAGELRDLTPIEPGQKANIEALSDTLPGTVAVGINARNPQVFDLFHVDIASGKRTHIMDNPGFAAWSLDNDLQPRIAFQQVPGGDMQVLRYVDGDWQPYYTQPAEDTLTSQIYGFAEDNRRYFMADSRSRDTSALMEVDIVSGDTTVLGHADNADIAYVWRDSQSGEPLAYATNHKRVSWTPLTEHAEDVLASLESQLQGDIQILSSTRDGSRLVVFNNSPTTTRGLSPAGCRCRHHQAAVQHPAATGAGAAAADAGNRNSRPGWIATGFLPHASCGQQQTGTHGALRTRRPLGARRLRLRHGASMAG